MGRHVHLHVPQVNILSDPSLLPVCFHSTLETIVSAGRSWRDFCLVVEQKLNCLDIVLKTPVRKFWHVDRERKLELLGLTCKQLQIAGTVVLVLGCKAELVQRHTGMYGIDDLAESDAVRTRLDFRVVGLTNLVEPL